ncbi:hypothetical protein GGI35DRAFT_483958 [Trichoderma velutinum]
MQATELTKAQREEMRRYIAGVHYAIPRSAQDAPSSHKLYESQKGFINKQPEKLSWPIFVILKTLYEEEKLPDRYVKVVRDTFGGTEIEYNSHNEDEVFSEGEVASKEEMSSEGQDVEEEPEDVRPPPKSASLITGKLFGKPITPVPKTPAAKVTKTLKRPASPTPRGRETRLVSRVKAVRETFGGNEIEGHSTEYYNIEGVLPAGLSEVAASKKKTWYWGLLCIKKYISQAAVMHYTEQREMYDYIVDHDYDMDRRSVAYDHKLYKKQMKMLEQHGKGSISWPAYLILSATYPCLSSFYEHLVRDTFDTSTVKDHTDEYPKATGTELEIALRTELDWSEFHASAY